MASGWMGPSNGCRIPAIAAAPVGSPVVNALSDHWDRYADHIPSSPKAEPSGLRRPVVDMRVRPAAIIENPKRLFLQL